MSGENSKRARARNLPSRNVPGKDQRSVRKRRHSNDQPRITTQELVPNSDFIETREGPLVGIQRENVRGFVLDIVRRGVDRVKTEYETPKVFNRTVLQTKEAMDANLARCRYKDVQCWDKTRVRLTFPPYNSNDFIHANHVRHESLMTQFICTQGPLDSTVEDFWRMVWQERCWLILMLCQCVEMRKIKCADYWPKAAGESKTFGPFIVTTSEVDTSDPNVHLTRMTLQYLGEMRRVEHRNWVSWPDKSVPRTATVAFKLLIYPKEDPYNPTLIHCSAGAGRTGTLILLELILRQVLVDHPQTIRVPELLKFLRLQRSHSVQTEDQFVFVHFALVQYALVRRAVTQEEVNGFVRDYESYLRVVEQSNKSKKKAKGAIKPTSDDEFSDKPPINTPRKTATRRRSQAPAAKKSNESIKPTQHAPPG